MKILRMIKRQLYKLEMMVLSDAPAWLILSHFKLNYLHRLSSTRRRFNKEKDLFRSFAKTLQLDNDWFTGNIPTWLMAFRKQLYNKKTELNCMEIGSWQGQSAVFVLNYFENANLTCVDTWMGADEHKFEDASSLEVLSRIEKDFDANVLEYKERITKYKGTSYQFFNDCFEREKFDLIYIDGSHHSDDVIVDTIKSFEMLKVNGLMILDDYFWKYYSETKDNPSGAINAFIRLKRNQLEVVCFDYQLVVRKIKNSVRRSVFPSFVTGAISMVL